MSATPTEIDGAATESAAPLAGRYRLVRVVGAGGMGVVWDAVNTWTGRRVALKRLRAHGADGRATLTTDATERFLREAQATARIRHPHVVEVLDMGPDDEGGLFIVYDFLEGETLRQLLERRGKLEPEEAAQVLLPVLEGLAAAHREAVLHRDLKPENVILAREPDGRVVPRLIDFGIARVDDPEAEKLTRTGAALGTAPYMSPEQARGAQDLDVRTDVWSAGVLWFEALTGARPYEGSGYNEVLARILTTTPPRLADALPGVARPLADAVDRALAHDREARHPSVDDFLVALRAALRGASAPALQPAPTARRSRALVLAGSVALAMGLALAVKLTPRAPSGAPAALQGPRSPDRREARAPAPPAAPAASSQPEAPPARTAVAAPAPLAATRRPEAPRRAPVVRRTEASAAVTLPSPSPPPPVNGALVLEP